VGTSKTLETTKQIHMSGEVPKGTMGSQKVVHEYLIHPTELKVLEPGRAMFKSGGRYGRLLLPGYFPDVNGVAIPQQSSTATSELLVTQPPPQVEPEFF